jgi:fatty-acid desaturase
VSVTTRSALIGAAVFLAAFGLLGWWMSRRNGILAAGLSTLLGVTGVYAGLWGVLEHRHWLFVPCVALMLASYAIEFGARHRSAHRDTKFTDPDGTPPRK